MFRNYLFILFGLACLFSGKLKAGYINSSLELTLVKNTFPVKADSVILNLQKVTENGFIETIVTGDDYSTMTYEFKITMDGKTYSSIIRDEVAVVVEVITDIPLYRERLKILKYQKVYNEINSAKYFDLAAYNDDDMMMIVVSSTCMNVTYSFVKLE